MLYAKGHEPTKELVEMVLKTLDVPIQALFSTLGRTAARTLETKLIADTDAGLVRRPDRQHQGRRHPHLQREEVGALHLAEPGRAPATWRPRAAPWDTGS
jgi:Ni,Fe-hydrogenase I large subunit